MPITRDRSRWRLAAVAAAAAAVIASLLVIATAGASPEAVSPPPTGAGFDYQIGGAYALPEGATVVSRDREDPPAEPGEPQGADVYSICYVNAFQVQPGELADWDDDLLLRDGNGEVIIDEEWQEALLDISTADRRERIAATVNGWIDGCAEAGYQAVEPDNFDSFTRSGGRFDDEAAMAYIALLSEHAHAQGLAIAQKNTSELSGERARTGLDFAIAEECGEQGNCHEFTAAYGDDVIVIEYTPEGLAAACREYGDRLSIVRRDSLVVTPDEDGYVRETC
ncbi:endo alpha-1,4 polygalactosaminidase [Streptomyces sp. B6B3]|uniref:endo alpha-1,4 polygalactosaminidase n=1 Tax=Streptomyces sp. B6B3 TaxID=3153570 RepID=UPI00325E9974